MRQKGAVSVQVQRTKNIARLLTKWWCCVVAATPGMALAAEAWLGSYQLGMSVGASHSYATIAYDTPRQAALPSDCEEHKVDNTLMHCSAYLARDADETPIPSLYLDEAFKRQGLLYFDLGLTFSTLAYQGGLVTKPKTTVPGGAKGTSGKTIANPEQPLSNAYLEMYGINWQTYLRLGLTPYLFPDILATFGVGLQTVGGRVRIMATDETRFVMQPQGFAELELVVLRFGRGAASLYVGQEQSFGGPMSKLAEDRPGGLPIFNLQAGFSTASAGLDILFPF